MAEQGRLAERSLAMSDEFALKGTDEAVRKMRALPLKLQKRGLRAAIRKGANIVKKAAQENAKKIDDPATAESIAKNVTVQFSSRLSKQEGGIAFRVGVLGGARQYASTRANQRAGRTGQTYKTGGDKGNPGGDTWYWRMVELGTSKARAQPFLQPALQNNIEAATAAIVNELNPQIDKLVAESA
jgi:HK97 gp10 family phage protein